jgi:hypothetical protein
MFITERGRLGMTKFGLKSSDTAALTLPLIDYLALGK